MDTQCQLLLYIDERRILDDMKEACLDFLKLVAEKPNEKFLPLRYFLKIDVIKLIDAYPDLGQLLLEEPMAFQRNASDVLYCCLRSMIYDSDYQVEPAQVAAILRPTNIPRLLARPNRHCYSGVVSFKGILISISKSLNYVYHSVWSCPELCDGNEVILQYIPKLPPKCIVCKSVLFENTNMRRCGEKVVATLKLENDFMPKTFTIVDDLIPNLRQGLSYVLIGVILKKVTTVWSVEEVYNLPAPLTSPIPKEIKKLFKACDGLPWKFIYCLASSLGINICPLNCFMHLKISLLLSLTSIKASILTESSILHVLVSGLDTGYVGRIMSEAAKLSENNVFLGTTNTNVSTALVGSGGGVCVMPLPLHTYNLKLTSAVLSAIESSEVSTDNGRVKLESAVWAHGMDFRKFVLFNVASVFGFICRGDYGEYNDELADFLLQNAVDPLEKSEEETRAMKDVVRYIDLVAGFHVSLDGAAEKLLRNYFLAARKERPRRVSAGSMSALVTVSLTSARLCRRVVANIHDAVFAIWLHVSGSPEPRFAPQEYLETPADVKKIQNLMNSFKEWLEQFTGGKIDGS